MTRKFRRVKKIIFAHIKNSINIQPKLYIKNRRKEIKLYFHDTFKELIVEIRSLFTILLECRGGIEEGCGKVNREEERRERRPRGKSEYQGS